MILRNVHDIQDKWLLSKKRQHEDIKRAGAFFLNKWLLKSRRLKEIILKSVGYYKTKILDFSKFEKSSLSRFALETCRQMDGWIDKQIKSLSFYCKKWMKLENSKKNEHG